jgi:hypothetical protein
MDEVLQYYQALVNNELALVSTGVASAFVFQLVVFRWVERSVLVTAAYFLTSISLIGGPLIAAVMAEPGRWLSFHDPVVRWTLLSFLATIGGIGASGAAPHGAAMDAHAPTSALGSCLLPMTRRLPT